MVSVVFSLLAMPASILGNEFALRFGRHRAISAVMFASAAVALLIGLFADKSPWLLLPLMLVYAITVPADSGALTSGMSMAADPEIPRRDHGDAFHRRLQPVRAWRVGGGRGARCCGRTAERIGLDGGICGAGGGYPAWAAGAVLVEKRDAP